MFEIMVVERDAKTNTALSCVISVSDRDVDSYVQGLIQEELDCVSSGIILNYTLIACHVPDPEYVPREYAIVQEVSL